MGRRRGRGEGLPPYRPGLHMCWRAQAPGGDGAERGGALVVKVYLIARAGPHPGWMDGRGVGWGGGLIGAVLTVRPRGESSGLPLIAIPRLLAYGSGEA